MRINKRQIGIICNKEQKKKWSNPAWVKKTHLT